MEEAADLVVRYGGSLSGEHGDGQARAELLPKMFGAELVRAFREFKAIWDPEGKMNPGKVVDPYPHGREPAARAATTTPGAGRPTSSFPTTAAASPAPRCAASGVGECRRTTAARCAPATWRRARRSTRTRGRARLLFEMLQGDAIQDGWRDESVKEALDLCLACKGCKGDCPVNVDMATYKAEFLSHYYAGSTAARARPTPWA